MWSGSGGGLNVGVGQKEKEGFGWLRGRRTIENKVVEWKWREGVKDKRVIVIN